MVRLPSSRTWHLGESGKMRALLGKDVPCVGARRVLQRALPSRMSMSFAFFPAASLGQTDANPLYLILLCLYPLHLDFTKYSWMVGKQGENSAQSRSENTPALWQLWARKIKLLNMLSLSGTSQDVLCLHSFQTHKQEQEGLGIFKLSLKNIDLKSSQNQQRGSRTRNYNMGFSLSGNKIINKPAKG